MGLLDLKQKPLHCYFSRYSTLEAVVSAFRSVGNSLWP